MSNLPGFPSIRTWPIEGLGFTERLHSALKEDGVHTIGDLLNRSEQDIDNLLPGYAMDEVREVQDALRRLNDRHGTRLQPKPSPQL